MGNTIGANSGGIIVILHEDLGSTLVFNGDHGPQSFISLVEFCGPLLFFPFDHFIVRPSIYGFRLFLFLYDNFLHMFMSN